MCYPRTHRQLDYLDPYDYRVHGFDGKDAVAATLPDPLRALFAHLTQLVELDAGFADTASRIIYEAKLLTALPSLETLHISGASLLVLPHSLPHCELSNRLLQTTVSSTAPAAATERTS